MRDKEVTVGDREIDWGHHESIYVHVCSIIHFVSSSTWEAMETSVSFMHGSHLRYGGAFLLA